MHQFTHTVVLKKTRTNYNLVLKNSSLSSQNDRNRTSQRFHQALPFLNNHNCIYLKQELDLSKQK